MSATFQQHMDFIYFLYGSAFLILAAFAQTPRRHGASRLPWPRLSLFAALHGLYEWWAGAAPAWEAVAPPILRIGLLAVSFAILLDFGLRGCAAYGPLPGRRGLFPGLLVLTVVLAARGGPAEWEAAVRYGLALPGAFLASLAFRRAARDSEGPGRGGLKAAAFFLLLYAIAAGLFTGPSALGPSQVLHTQAWLHGTGLPMEVVRAVIAAGLAAALWTISMAHLPRTGHALQHEAPLRLKTTISALAGVFLATWIGTDALGRLAGRMLRTSILERASSVANLLDPSLLSALRASPTDERHPVVHEVESMLTRARLAFPDVQQIYLYGLRGGRFMFYASSEARTPSARVRPGDLYEGDISPQDYTFFNTAKPYTFGPFTDRWGRWVSATVPALREEGDGRVRLALGLDIAADDYLQSIARWRLIGLGLGALLVLLILDFFTRHHRLWESALRLAAAEREQRALSADLEQRVHQRTRELAEANRALRTEMQQHREAGERYRLLFEYAPAGVFHYDRELRITEFNDRFAALLRKSRRDLAGAPLEELADAAILPTLRAALDGGEGYHEGSRGFIALEEDTWISLRAAPLFDAAGAITSGIAIVQDLSERRRIEEERMRTQKLESLGLLAGGLAHDFNNILTAILGNISAAREPGTPPAELAEALQDAERAAIRARDLTHQLLTFAKGGAPIKKLHDVGAVVREAAGFTVRGSASRCVYKIDPDTWRAEIDSGQITQVIQNLIINADQAMPAGGVITIETANRHVGANEVPRLAPGRYVQVRVSDTGTGIPDRLIGRIFDPYFTTKKKGSGLGLTMCFSIVQKHGGLIEVTSEPGNGAAFTFYLPAASETAELPAEAAAAPRAATGQGRILVMDDEKPILGLAQRALGRAGYEVLVADRGEEAVRLLDEELRAGRRVDLAILDITVPGGMGGREALRHLRARDPGLNAIVSSGYAPDEVLAQFKSAGFSGILPKPYRADDLLDAVRRALHREEHPTQA